MISIRPLSFARIGATLVLRRSQTFLHSCARAIPDGCNSSPY